MRFGNTRCPLLALMFMVSAACVQQTKLHPPEMSEPPVSQTAVKWQDSKQLTGKLAVAILTSAWSEQQISNGSYPLLLVGDIEGCQPGSELSGNYADDLTKALLSTGKYRIAAPREGLPRPALPETAAEASGMLSHSGAEYYVQSVFSQQEESAVIELRVWDLKAYAEVCNITQRVDKE